MFIVRLYGGLGNQMFQYAMVRAQAQRYVQSFKLDTAFFSQHKSGITDRRYALDGFMIKNQLANFAEVVKAAGGLIAWSAWRARGRFPALAAWSKVISDEDGLVDLSGKTDVYFDGYWQDPKYFCDIEGLLAQEFSCPPNQLQQHPLFHLTQDRQTVAMHVRRGDYVTLAPNRQQYDQKQLAYYRQACQLLASRLGDFKSLVFSDDIDWCRRNLAWLPQVVFVDSGNEVSDFCLLKSCSHAVIANSTFSWWAARLGPAKSGLVISPKFWLGGNDNPNYVII